MQSAMGCGGGYLGIGLVQHSEAALTLLSKGHSRGYICSVELKKIRLPLQNPRKTKMREKAIASASAQ